MPRPIDHEERKRAIMDALMRSLAEHGYDGMSLRRVAHRMGGSPTLITHYYPNRDALIKGLTDYSVGLSASTIDDLEAIEHPRARLHSVLRDFLPLTEDDVMLERARLALVLKDDIPAIVEGRNQMEAAMRRLFRLALEGFVDPDELEVMVDLSRAWASGMALSAVEHPEIWTPERQLRALDQFMSSLAVEPMGEARESKSSRRLRGEEPDQRASIENGVKKNNEGSGLRRTRRT